MELAKISNNQGRQDMFWVASIITDIFAETESVWTNIVCDS